MSLAPYEYKTNYVLSPRMETKLEFAAMNVVAYKTTVEEMDQ